MTVRYQLVCDDCGAESQPVDSWGTIVLRLLNTYGWQHIRSADPAVKPQHFCPPCAARRDGVL